MSRYSIKDFVESAKQRDKGEGLFELQSERLLEINLSDTVWTKTGSMVAYTGDIKFTREGVLEHGAGKMLKRFMTRKGTRLTKAEGRGKLYLADAGKKVTILQLEGETLFVNGNDVLAFEDVIRRCAEVPRPGQDGTWITSDMIDAYCRLHELGFAHSAEAWQAGELVGGAYGVSLGAAFFGESMFARHPDASKVAFVHLVRQLEAWDFELVDCQVHTDHLESFGAREWRRNHFLDALAGTLEAPTRRGQWALEWGP